MQSTRRSILKGSTAAALGTLTGSRRPHTTTAGGDATDQLWETLLRQFLQDPQWMPDYAYDAGHALMVPLHVAYSPGSQDFWADEFEAHTQSLVSALDSGTDLPENPITRQQYLYLFTRQALLQKQAGLSDRINWRLIEIIAADQAQTWSSTPRHWSEVNFATMRELIEWKLTTVDKDRSFYGAIIDDELFNFAIAADLCALLGEEASAEAKQTVTYADLVIESEGVFTEDGGWLFQPGVWWDHRDYAFAGYDRPKNGMEPKPVLGIAVDTNHSHRWPRWLGSLAFALDDDDRREQYANVLAALARQFLSAALVTPSKDFPSGFRTTNYLDGNNGLYRWEYETQGENNGYLPFEVSGTLVLGWWAFLETNDIRDMFASMVKSFPLSDDVVDVYTGPNTTRVRHPMMVWPEYFTSGFAELVVRLAALI